MHKYRLLVDGKWVEARSGRTFEVRNPADGQVVAVGAYGEETETEAAVDAAMRAFKIWSATPAAVRAEALRNLHALLLEHAEEMAGRITREMGKPIRESRTEVKLAADYLLWNAEEARRIYGLTVQSQYPDKRLQVIHQAVGPVAAITPWNFPIAMVTRKVAPALAAGCTVVFKPASQTPGAAVLLFELAQRAGIPDGVLNLVTGSPAKIGDTLLKDRRIRKMTFTGSTEIGKTLMKKAADQVKRISMELGGHAPFIVFEDADLELAVNGAVASKFRNTGQTCICANRIFVQASIKDEFLALFKEKVEALKMGDGMAEDTEIGPLVDRPSLQKVHAQVEDAVRKGAVLVSGGQACSVDGLTNGIFYAPTILDRVNDEMAITTEETFGPVAPIYTFHTEEEAVERANRTVYGLASYFFTNDLSRATRVAEALEYGMVGVNDAMTTTVQGPFGGIKESGLGREGGPDSLHDFLETKFISTVIRSKA